MESAERTSPEVWVRHTFDGMFSEGESETRRRLYAEISELDPRVAAVPTDEFAREYLVAELNLFASLAASINPDAADLVPLIKRQYVARLSAEMKHKIEKADIPYGMRVREYESKRIWPYTAVAEVFIERLGCRPVPLLMRRVELALAVLGELWQMEALQYTLE